MNHPKSIEYIQWGVLSKSEWEHLAVINITKPSPKDDTKDRANTPCDPRLGEQRSRVDCETCKQKQIKCPGHFGLITLPKPVYNLVFIGIVLKLLQCVCSKCARPRILPFHMEILGFMRYKGYSRFKAIAKKCDKSLKICPWDDCCEPLNYYSLPIKKKKETGKIYYTVESSSIRESFNSEDAYDVLSRISNDDLKLLGFNSGLLSNGIYSDSSHHAHLFRPESMIYTVIPVLPPSARPFIQDKDGIKNDDLTAKYDDLIKSIAVYNSFTHRSDISTDTLSTENTSSCIVSTRRGRIKTKSDIERDIMEHVWTLTTNKDIKSSTSQTHRSIACRLTGKEGRFQQNVGGKRTNYSARTVIVGGGIRLRNDELGVPQDIAEIETKTVFVGPWNIDECQSLVAMGKVNSVERFVNGEHTIFNFKRLESGGRDFILNYGDEIRRHLQDGDIVIINRQPTLRLENMIAFRAKIIDGMAFMLGLAWTRGFNADFDGNRF